MLAFFFLFFFLIRKYLYSEKDIDEVRGTRIVLSNYERKKKKRKKNATLVTRKKKLHL